MKLYCDCYKMREYFLEATVDELEWGKKGIWQAINMRENPSGNGYLLTFSYSKSDGKGKKRRDIYVGWGIKMCYCPFCGARLKENNNGKETND